MRESVLVTGAATSVGRVVAERFQRRGDRVHVCDVDAAALSEMLAANPEIRGTTAHVGRAADVQRIFDDAAWMGDVTVLINNVGIGGPRAALEDVSIADWSETIETNLSGTFYLMKHAIPGMKRLRRGVIINVSSGSTRTRLPARTPYVTSKFGVEGLTLNAARELGPFNIRCNAILPGMINNDRMRRIVRASAEASGRTVEQVEEAYLKYISLRSKTEPSEVADMILFIASEGAKMVTGELIAVSGNCEWEE
jgi:NAD(P)-dependent dehydrogenase (short-subunit alcohol dehydrogenase family)